MIFDLINSYRKYFEDEKIVLDSYHLQNGIYVLFKKDGTHEILKIDKKNSEENTTTSLYEYIKVRDFYSNYIDSNKALDTSYKEKRNGKVYSTERKICSNNQYTLFFKNRFVEGLIKDPKDTIPADIFLKGIDKYFSSMLELGKNNKKTEMILEKIKDNISTDEEIIKNKESLKQKFLETIELLKSEELTKDTWIKIFLEADELEYEKASIKYTYLRLFNKNDENKIINEKVYGINNYNFGYTTTKKPFTELKSTPFKVASMISLEDIKVVRNMYIWLLKNVTTKDFVKIPLDFDFKGLDDTRINGKPIYLLSVVNDNGTAKVKDFDFIPFYSNTIKPYKCTNYFNTNFNLEECEFITNDINELEKRVSKIWFSNSLRDSYYNYKDIVAKRSMIPNWKKEIIKENKDIFLEFFHKSNNIPLKQNLDKLAFNICYKTLIDEYKDGKTFNAIKAMNLWIAFDEYLGGNFKMIKNDIYLKSKEVVLNKEKIESDEMYFFLIGQVVKYLLSKSKANTKTQSMLDPIMKASSQKRLINVILQMRDKYSYSLMLSNAKFDNILKQILVDTVEKDIVKNKKYILAGFLEENLFYIKDEENLKEEII